MNYLLQLLILINIYVVLSLSLNLLVGYVGLLSLCHAAFYGIGAYASTLLAMKLGVGFVPSMLLGAAAAAILSLSISIPSLRLRGDYFVLASLGFQMIAYAVLYNWVGLTRGPFGISEIPKPAVLGLDVSDISSYAILATVVAALCGFLLYLISASPFGRTLKAIREDEVAAAALGKNVYRLKVTAFALAAGFAAISGALFASYVRYIDPTSFTLTESVLVLSMVIIGGAGNISGPIIGSTLLLLLPVVLRYAEIPETVAANVRQMIYGALIIAIMRYQPNGLRGEYKFE